MRTLWQDVRYGFRMLRRTPGFTLIALVSIALGLGVNTTIFSFVNAALFRPLDFPNSYQLVRLWDGMASSYPDYVAYRDESNVFSGLAAYSLRPMSLRIAGGETERIYGEIVTGNYFDVLDVRPLYGRGFLAEEDRTPGTHAVVVISNKLWRERFNSAPEAVGQNININNHAYTIIGVMPENFVGATVVSPPDLWIPMMMEPLAVPGSRSLTSPDSGWLMMMGRLKPDVSLAESQAAIETIAARLHEARRARRSEPDGSVQRIAQVVPARGLMPPPQGRTTVFFVAGLLMTVVGLVLLVACANVSNMLLARASVRRKEIAVRLALGASRWRIVRQMLTESLLLALLGGVGGLLLTLWSTDLLLTLLPLSGNSIAPDVSPDVRVFAYTLLLSIATGIVFGLVPALQSSKPDLVATLKDENASQRFGRSKLRNLLVVGQVAVSLALLISAGLFIRSLQNSQSVNPGFEIENGLVMAVDLRPTSYGEDEARGREFYRQLLERIEALPGVCSASLAEIVPLSMNTSTTGITVEDGAVAPDTRFLIDLNSVAPRYFETMSVPVLQGREFTATDTGNAPPVAIINETMARQFWTNSADAIGKRFRFGGQEGDLYEVVGVVRDIKYGTLGEDSQPFMYFSFLQHYEVAANVHVRTTSDPRALRNAVQRAALDIDPTMPSFEVQTMSEAIAFSFFPSRVAASLLGALGGLGLVLALVGIYGVMSYFVAHRTREIGVRMALGAQDSDVLRFVVRRGMSLVLIGIAIGLAASLAVTRLMRSLLYGVSAIDPLTFLGVSLLLAAVALVAILIPARRAMRVDPMVALRYE